VEAYAAHVLPRFGHEFEKFFGKGVKVGVDDHGVAPVPNKTAE
jgi:hypothetical protein